ncbi:pentatricopeptide repeat domain-containing protein [Spizellomyces punctatus DAOM BR117]|uniref:Pentatricopeptide repeat domain-containing protein n=1 Tax=Spizellomyces punctatus (strain DAOM BR117) TaxID=645134 RepID=A0A0L0H9U7_SPIPD|nr:pentatricopeptide repeat domain-containing protein [Spizellomyces punctatus DAOM BR117]KNC97786.1 pentatricopeptide repeat domain-containing protein [Spizellomyces punctatus DAOM BR117]|eukprot:XP_016605826.1 pentatricopeptide repeat domain-containing protein [Spizellomyces punctatus DAOM BR117]
MRRPPSLKEYEIISAALTKGAIPPEYRGVLSDMEVDGITPNAVVLSNLVMGMAKTSNPGSVRALMGEITFTGMKLEKEVYKVVLCSLIKKGYTAQALELYNRIWREGTSLDADTYEGLIRAFATAKKPALMMRMFRDMKHAGVDMSVTVYATIATALAQTSEVENALSYAKKIIEKRSALTMSVSLALIPPLAKRGKWKELEFVLYRSLYKDQEVGDLLGALVIGMAQAKDAQEALNGGKRLIEKYLLPGMADANGLAARLCMDGHLDAALLIDKLMRWSLKTPTMEAYHPLVKALIKAKRFDELTQLRTHFVRDLPPSESSNLLNLLIVAYSAGRDGSSLDTLTGVIHQMKEHSLVISANAYNAAIKAYCSQKDWANAYTLYEEMRLLKVEPLATVKSSVLQLASETGNFLSGTTIYNDMTEKHRQELPLARTWAMMIYFGLERWDDGFAVWETLRQMRNPPRMALKAVMEAAARTGRLEVLLSPVPTSSLAVQLPTAPAFDVNEHEATDEIVVRHANADTGEWSDTAEQLKSDTAEHSGAIEAAREKAVIDAATQKPLTTSPSPTQDITPPPRRYIFTPISTTKLIDTLIKTGRVELLPTVIRWMKDTNRIATSAGLESAYVALVTKGGYEASVRDVLDMLNRPIPDAL